MRFASVVAVAALFLAGAAHAADEPAVIAVARQRIEATDSRGTGHLVRVDATGKRISSAFSAKAHWFPGVLRVLLQITPARTPSAAEPQNEPPSEQQEARISILFEMRPGGQSTIRIFHPHESAPTSLPFDKWSGSVLGSDFNYEDFLQAEYYWKNQVMVKSVRLGSHDCDVVKSTPGASDRSSYAEVQSSLDHTIGYPLSVEKTLKAAAIVKEFTYLGLTKSDGVWAARQVQVKTHGRPGSTLLLIDRGSARANLTIKDFSPEQISHFEDHP